MTSEYSPSNPPAKLVFAFGSAGCEGDPSRVDLLGGKGASLAAMSQAGFPVPPGFTISAECCAWVQDHAGSWPPGLEVQIRLALGKLERETGRTFGRGPKPLLVAVRSGAPVSMPGMMDTILNCGLHPGLLPHFGSASPEKFWREYADHLRMFAASVADLKLTADESAAPETVCRLFAEKYLEKTGRPFPTDPWESLVACINAVFASWNSDRAVAYRQHHGVRHVIGTAVNVQMMFPSERSGVLFTRDPNRPGVEEMILEASWGLGEVVVSGAVTPDIYVLDRQGLRLKRTTAGDRPGGQPALTESQVREIGELGRRVEEHFAVPSDIEWGIADGRVALLQTRAIRGLDVLEDAEHGRREEIERLRELANGRHAVWVVHNLAETLPAPTPLTWDIVRPFMSGRGGFGRMYRELGYRPSREVDRDGFLELICGRIYVDPQRAAGLFWGDLPFAYDLDALLHDRQVLERPPTKLDVERGDPFLFVRLPGMVWSMLRSARIVRRMKRTVRQRFEQRALPKFREFLHTANQRRLDTLPTAALLDELDRRREYVLGEFAAESLLPGFFAGWAYGRLLRRLTQLLGPEPAVTLASRLTAGLEGDVTVRQNLLLHEVAHGRLPLADFLTEFGHRAANEMELSEPRWREDTSYLHRLLDSFRTARGPSPEQRHAEQAAVRRQAEAELPAVLAEWGGSAQRELIQQDLSLAQTLLPFRELGKFYLMQGYDTLRNVLVELSRRWELERDIFFLQVSELRSFEAERAECERRIEQRKLRWKSAQRLTLRDVIDSASLDSLGLPDDVAAAEGQGRLEARPIATGAAAGIARIVHDPRQAVDLSGDYILVCPSTDPGWTPLFVHAKGLIVERGGILSHGAIVARDFGIPAVVLENATRRIPDGARIEIDGNRGLVVFLEMG